MPLVPAAPQGLHGLVEAIARTTHAVVDLTRACSDDDLAQPAPSVQDGGCTTR